MTTNEAEHIAQVAALPEEDAAPLLPGPTVSPLQVELGQQYDEFADFSTRLRQEAGKQWRLAGPLVLQSVVVCARTVNASFASFESLQLCINFWCRLSAPTSSLLSLSDTWECVLHTHS